MDTSLGNSYLFIFVCHHGIFALSSVSAEIQTFSHVFQSPNISNAFFQAYSLILIIHLFILAFFIWSCSYWMINSIIQSSIRINNNIFFHFIFFSLLYPNISPILSWDNNAVHPSIIGLPKG